MGGCGLKGGCAVKNGFGVRSAFGNNNSQVTNYNIASAGAHEVCECGEIFEPAEARFCCYCGRKREGASSSSSVGPTCSSPRESREQKFSTLVPNGAASSPTNSPVQRSSGGNRPENRFWTTTSNGTFTTHHLDDSETARSSSDDEKIETPESEESEVASRSGAQATIKQESPWNRRSGGKLTPSGSFSGTPARRPSFDVPGTPAPGLLFDANGSPVEDMVSALTQALMHSGSIDTQKLRMRALQVPESLVAAYNAAPKADMLMPQFEVKVDLDNLLPKLPTGSLRAALSFQRVTFMSTDWLGIRLEHGDHSQCTRFCLCATALQNIGKNTSRSVVVECSDEEQCLVFACSPMAKGRLETNSTIMDHAEEIAELATIILNEGGNPEKKVTSDLKNWCAKTQRQAETDAQEAERNRNESGETDFQGVPSEQSEKQVEVKERRLSRPRFSLSGFVKVLEDAFANLGNESKPKGGPNKGTATRRRGSAPEITITAPADTKPELPRRSASFAGSLPRQRRPSYNGDDMNAPSRIDSNGSLPRSPSRERKVNRHNSNPDLAQLRRGSQRSHSSTTTSSEPSQESSDRDDSSTRSQHLEISPKAMKRRPSFGVADIMPTLDENKETDVGLKAKTGSKAGEVGDRIQHYRSEPTHSKHKKSIPTIKRRHSLPVLDAADDNAERLLRRAGRSASGSAAHFRHHARRRSDELLEPAARH